MSLVSNENYEVIAGLFDNDKQECYGVLHKKYRIVEVHTRSLTFANLYAVSANRMVLRKVWEGDASDELADLGALLTSTNRKAN
jgi:hypothetical protein